MAEINTVVSDALQVTHPSPSDGQLLMRRIAIGASAYLLGSNLFYLITKGAFHSPDRWETVYLVLLGAYAGGPEVRHWAKGTDAEAPDSWQEKTRKGGPLILAWVLLLFLAGLWRQADPTVPMPPELESITIKVIGLFFGTYAFRQFRRVRPLGPRKTSQDAEETAERQRILEALGHGPLSSRALRDIVHIPPRTLARLLKAMLDDKLVVRQADSPTDPSATYRLK